VEEGDILYDKDESFRDSIGTIDEQGNRKWVYAQQPKGKFYNWRKLATVFYLIVFFGLPFIKVNGNPLFMFHVLKGKFILFGQVFWPQDFYLFGLGMLTFIVFIVVFTVIFGRVFCGWACPQTIFMEMIFRRIEYWIEGDAAAQRLLNNGPWNSDKVKKKVIKNVAFFLLSFIIANTLLSYLIGVDELGEIITGPLSENAGSLLLMLIFTSVFYGVYVRFREQVCLVVCPYGRLQGVLLDKHSIVVTYDYVRGEPRGKYKKNEERSLGDCIDCHQCVKVCPTAIDIRNGTQLECTNCTACMDACDNIMEKVGLPKGLIRYDSEEGIRTKKKLRITPRIVAYSIVLVILFSVEVALLATRSDVDTSIIRARGMLYQELADDKISNLYNIKLVNKTYRELPVELRLENIKGEIQMVGKDLTVPAENILAGGFFIVVPKEELSERKTKIKIGVYSNGEKIRTVETSFLGPFAMKKRNQ
jgi:cytochrome c oxidase accessory protein FixG